MDPKSTGGCLLTAKAEGSCFEISANRYKLFAVFAVLPKLPEPGGDVRVVSETNTSPSQAVSLTSPRVYRDTGTDPGKRLGEVTRWAIRERAPFVFRDRWRREVQERPELAWGPGVETN